MPHWMIHPDHGTNPVYDTGAVELAKKYGWALLNTGESPDYSKKAGVLKTAPVLAPVAPSPIAEEPPKESADLLEQPVVQIVPQLQSMGMADLEALRAREQSGKNRKGLMAVLSDAISARKG